MAAVTYKCHCGRTWRRVLSPPPETDICQCGGLAKREFLGVSSITYEIRDRYRGVKIRQDLMRQLRDRSHDHTMKHRVDDVISAQGLKAAKEMGYLNEKGGKKTKWDEI